MLRKGIVASATFPGIRDDLRQFRQAVADVTAAGVFDGFEFYYAGTPAEEREIGALLERSGLYPSYLPGFEMKRDGLDLGAERWEDRRRAVDRCLGFVRTAYNTRARKMLILSGPRPAGPFDPEEYLARFSLSLEEILAYAEAQAGEYILEITLEFFNDTGEPWLAIGGARTVDRLLGMPCAAHTHLGVTFDTSHVAQLREDLREDYRLLAPRIRHIHLANCVIDDASDPLYGDRHPVFNLPGGVFRDRDMASFLSWTAQEPGFDRVDLCSVEIIPHPGMEPVECFRHAVASARAVFSALG
ncbi:MAG: TIM barrel protein [Clostridia bacterium]|nr:TIM barrel protein [Clostridia bacterium]